VRAPRSHRPRRKGRGKGSKAVAVITRYWPPKKLVKDVAKHSFGCGAGGADLHVINPGPNPASHEWGEIEDELAGIARLYRGRVAVAIIPLGLPLWMLGLLSETCEDLGIPTYLALVEKARRRNARKERIFGPKWRRYAYVGLANEWAITLVILNTVGRQP